MNSISHAFSIALIVTDHPSHIDSDYDTVPVNKPLSEHSVSIVLEGQVQISGG